MFSEPINVVQNHFKHHEQIGWLIDETPTDITAQDQSGSGSNDNVLKLIIVFAFQKKMFVSQWGVDNTSSPFYRQSILTSNFASCLSGPFFLSSSLQLIPCSLVFISEPTFMQQKFAYNVGLVSTYSAHYNSTFSRFSPTSNLR